MLPCRDWAGAIVNVCQKLFQKIPIECGEYKQERTVLGQCFTIILFLACLHPMWWNGVQTILPKKLQLKVERNKMEHPITLLIMSLKLFSTSIGLA
jgi:hypothetical protein